MRIYLDTNAADKQARRLVVADHRGGGEAPASSDGPADEAVRRTPSRATTRSSSASTTGSCSSPARTSPGARRTATSNSASCIDNANLAEAVEHEMRQVEDFLFEHVLDDMYRQFGR